MRLRLKSSFRLKIVVWYTIGVLSTLIIFRIVSIQLISDSLYENLDTSLDAEINWVRDVLNSYKELNLSEAQILEDISRRSRLSPRKEYIEIFDNNGKLYFRSQNLGIENLKSLSENYTYEPITISNFRGHPLRLQSIKDANYEIYIGYPLTDIDIAIDKILSSFLLLIPLVLLLIFSGGLIIVNKFVRPIRELNIYADKLIQQPLDEEIEKISIHTKDEMGELITKINNVTEKMRNSMRQTLSFSTLAAHELRSPLAIIRNQLENVMRPNITNEIYKKTLASVYDDILRLNRTVNDLLSLGTLQAGTFKLEMEPVDISLFLKDFYEEALMLSREKNISVVLRGGEKKEIQLDVYRIRQVLFNLLDNSLRNTQKNGRIRINYDISNNHVNITFADTGCGIPKNEISKIFDPFHRAISKNGYPYGTGLGLALVKSIIEAHKGKISVESEIGKGTTFYIKLPILNDF